MNLSKTAQYAVRAVTTIAFCKDEVCTSNKLIKKLNVSQKYLRHILTTLTKNKIICSVQGRKGGFKICANPDEIRLYDIILAVEDIEKYYGCILGFNECSDENPCALHEQCVPIRDRIFNFLLNNTISDILKNPTILKF